ncbi:MAG: hypothetical protein A2900_04945 [Candidatus Chisholmbacteria bacterium RIFCSPLOWO2_01_FULL_50_28]|uniref:Uncharacterized protein n=1 Tax=Candidatus Chisholmbacteria bacterium RIFCSPHIGHO2_01_FULL_52_32 TaxID=1797591 RepID=A0A1G1VS46_9BACT|nr:MAG: hypothetical protein A2786_01795 [Candidatus Chisholmbacteria bacterium RIFCSPHIGHO2_01_FULL_52_32]OGY20395.1 MAG: hypothetical protein A2900_04945 [Candidatus Chisholmbacteria bacterium RIFCSPLOWO2_01_FULL_50_28]
MRPDFEQYRNAGERLIPCCPPLLSGIGKVYVATENERKLTAVRDLLGKYPILRGTEFLVPEPHKLTGEEPPWENAVLVSRDKVENVVSQLHGKFGPKTAVFGSDIVVWFNGKPYQNLSRLGHLSEDELIVEVRQLQEVFSTEAEVRWDVATSVSRPEVQVTLADRHTARFSPVPAAEIADAFWGDISGVLGRNSRIQLLERFPDHVIEVESIPFVQIADRDGVFRSGSEWMCGEGQAIGSWEYLCEIQAQVVGGLPVNGRLNDLLNVSPNSSANGGWRLL